MRSEIGVVIVLLFLALGIVIFLMGSENFDGSDLADTPWPMFRGGARHTGRSPYDGPQENDLKWSFETGDSVFSSPAIGENGTIYVGSKCDDVYAVNSDGTLKWSYQTGGDVISSPAIGSDGTIYVGSLDDRLYAIGGDDSE